MEQSFGNEMDEFITLDWRRSIDTDKKKGKQGEEPLKQNYRLISKPKLSL